MSTPGRSIDESSVKEPEEMILMHDVELGKAVEESDEEIDIGELTDEKWSWVESKRYWYLLSHVALLIIGTTVLLLFFISAPGLWKSFNHTLECDDTQAPSNALGWEVPTNAFDFADLFTLFPQYPHIHWVEKDGGPAWIQEQVDPSNNARSLMCYQYADAVLESWDPSQDHDQSPSETVFYSEDNFPQNADTYLISPDGAYILFAFDISPVYRHSYSARWQVCDVQQIHCENLIPGDNTADVMLAQWSPNNFISYVRDNDLWIVSDPANIQNTTQQITFDGQQALNGVADWVYEEEILESSLAHFWAPDSSQLVFMKFEQADMPTYSIPLYHVNQTYPDLWTYKYPCAGTDGPVVSLWVYTLATGASYQVELPTQAEDQYITAVEWANGSEFAYFILNRAQNQQDLYVHSTTEQTNSLLDAQRVDDGWVDPYYRIHAIAEGEHFIIMLPQEDRKHFVLVPRSGSMKDLNKGQAYDVESFLGFDEATRTLYYTVHAPNPRNLNIMALAIDEDELVPVNLSGDDSTYATGSLSPSGQLLVRYVYGSSVPFTDILVPSTRSQEPISVIDSNEEFASDLEERAMPTREFWEVPSAEEGVSLHAVAYLPPDMDQSGETQYPVLMYVYGGPDSQTVNEEFELSSWNFHSFLASSMGVIVVSVDNRGTCCRGQEFLKQTYHDLGNVETQDQLAAMDFISEKPFVDAERIGIWGWSYGGYMAARVVSASWSGNTQIRGAVSVAPVTDWKFYDNVYTERYMSTPAENPSGYQASSVLGRAQYIKEKSYLLIHGTGDDNVHFQNSADWVTNMVNSGVNFQTMYYPDKAHSLAGLETRMHLWRTITRFLAQLFDLPVPSLEVPTTPRVSKAIHTSRLPSSGNRVDRMPF